MSLVRSCSIMFTLLTTKIRSKLLLRIYGPQVEHLIDREAELQILRRLARQRIGPRLLGTFKNGRFEEYFYAHALTPKELKTPDVYMQIAKRMRELHDGIELLPEERNAGPFIWRNWDKWVDRCARIVSYIDRQVLSDSPNTPTKAFFKRRGMTCGVEWRVFRETVERYRKWLNDQYGGPQRVREELVFAHNDVGAFNKQRTRTAQQYLTYIVGRLNTATFFDLIRPGSHHYYCPPIRTSG